MDKSLGRQWQTSQVAASFSRSAANYDSVAVLQRQTGDELLDRLALLKNIPNTVLDLGAGTGRQTTMLAARYPKSHIIALDIAPAMLQQARLQHQKALGLSRYLPKNKRTRYLSGDAESLPLADSSVDLVYANLCLQWCDPRRCFNEIQRVLRPGVALMFTTLGPDTLTELRQAWAAVDNYPHVNQFIDMHDVGEAMAVAGLAQPVLDTDRYTLTYDNVHSLMQDLKILGARNIHADRRRGLTGRQAFVNVAEAYEPFRKQDILPATYEVIYGHAWCGEVRQQQGEEGIINIPISQIQGRK